MSPTAEIGRVIEFQWRGRKKKIKVKITAVEYATAVPSDDVDIWFWAKYV